MTLGTGVFLAAIMMSLTALFIATKDRWKWKNIILWPLALMAVLGLALWGYIAYSDYESHRPKVAEGWWGLSLSATKEDVRFKKGEPVRILTDDDGAEIWLFGGTDWAKELLEDGDNLHHYEGRAEPNLLLPQIQRLLRS